MAENAVGRLRLDAFGSGSMGFTIADKRILGSTGGYNDVVSADITVPMGESWTATGYSSGAVTGDADTMLTGGRFHARVTRNPPLGFGGGISATETTPDFRQEMGFLTQSGLRNGSAWLNHTHGQDSRLWTTAVNTTGTFERDGDRYAHAELVENATIGVHNASISGRLQQWEQTGEEVSGYTVSGSWNAILAKAVKLSASSAVSRQLDYAALVPADSVQTTAGGALRPTAGIRFDFDVNRQWYTPQDDAPQTFTRLYTRFNWQFTELMGLRIFQQTTLTDDADPQTGISALLTWMRTPGNELYVGSTWSVDEGVQEQILFAKLTRLWQL